MTQRVFELTDQLTGPENVSFGGALNAISLSPDGSQIAVAGREVLKIIRLDNLAELRSLRVSSRANLNYSSVDIKWHPMEQHKQTIATAATNGAVVVWNIATGSERIQERIITDHTRTVNRISWHPDHAFTLLSGSQDGTMKLWDIRDPTNCKVTFDPKSEAVRDVQFNPFLSNFVVAAFDNGTVQTWDIRKHTSPEKRIAAHQGPVYCVRWHHEDKNIFASGGRDRFIQVWDTNSLVKPMNTIETVQSVSHLLWRPMHKTHITSSALMDGKVHVWDIKRPYTPVITYVNHQDVVTDILYEKGSAYKILTAGKDGVLWKQNATQAYKPYENIRTTGLSWNPQGELAAFNFKINRRAAEQLAPKKNELTNQSFQKSGPVVLVDKLRKTLQAPNFNHDSFIQLANKYKTDGMSFEKLCLHNFSVCQEVGELQLAQTWKLLNLFFEKLDPQNQSNSGSSKPTPSHSKTHSHAKTDSQTLGAPKLLPSLSQESLMKRVEPKQTNLDDSQLSTGIPSLVKQNSLGDTSAVASTASNNSLKLPENLNTSASMQVGQISTELTPQQQPVTPSLLSSSSDQIGKQKQTNTTNKTQQTPSNDSLDDILSSDLTFDLAPVPADSTILSSVPSLLSPSNTNPTISHSGSNNSQQNQSINQSGNSLQSHALSQENLVARLKEMEFNPSSTTNASVVRSTPADFPRWDATLSVLKILDFYADNGDVQTAIIMSFVLGDRVSIPRPKLIQWTTSYIEQLQRLKQWVPANDLIQKSKEPFIRSANQKSTTVYTSCANCNTMVEEAHTLCTKCKKLVSRCCLCNQKVVGLYVWCQGCGHGGHLQHLTQWFQNEQICPVAGCAHPCSALAEKLRKSSVGVVSPTIMNSNINSSHNSPMK